MESIVWGIEGWVRGHAGACISFTLGPYVGVPDEAEIQSVLIGLGELLACHGQYVSYSVVNPVKYIGGQLLDRVHDASKAIAPEEARERNEEHWKTLDQYLRKSFIHAPTQIQSV